MTNARRVLVQGSRALPGTGVFLRLDGEKTKRVHALANDFSEARLAFVLNDEVSKDALIEIANVVP